MENKMKIKTNPNTALVKEIVQLIAKNDGYCCCMASKNEDTKCMCKNFKESTESGFCHCGRFYKYKDFPTVAICNIIEDWEAANEIARQLEGEGLVVYAPSGSNRVGNIEEIYEVQMTKIAKADVVFIMNTSAEAVAHLAEMIMWAEELGKQIIFLHTDPEEKYED